MRDVKELVLPHLRSPERYKGVQPLEAMAEEAGIPPEKVIRLNGNENPYGSSPKVAEALASFSRYNHYIDPQQQNLREVLSTYAGVGPEHIVAGNGSDEIIDLIIRLFVSAGEKIIQPTPTFGMYRFSAQLVGSKVVSVPRDGNFELAIESIELAVDEETKVIFVASPNNPTGNVASEEQIHKLLELGPVVAVDEAYHEYCGQTAIPLLNEYPNLIVLRTFSKWAGLAGLRLGLGVMAPEVARVMMTIKPPYNMNRAAEVALVASLEDREVLMERVKLIVQERGRMYSLLKTIPQVKPLPSQANFLLVRLSQGRGQEIFEGLARKGIFVRYYSDPGMEDCIRISIGLPDQTDALVDALRDLVKE